MTIHRLRTVFLAAVLVLALCAPLETLQVRGAAAATTLKFDGSTPTRTQGIVALAAILTGPDRKPLSKRPVNFYEHVDLMGPREALIGTAETDSTGTATVSYQPSNDGAQTITVRFPGDTAYAASEASDTIQISGAVPPYAPLAEPLAVPAWLLPRAMGLLIVLTWLILFGVFITTALGIRRLGRGTNANA